MRVMSVLRGPICQFSIGYGLCWAPTLQSCMATAAIGTVCALGYLHKAFVDSRFLPRDEGCNITFPH